MRHLVHILFLSLTTLVLGACADIGGHDHNHGDDKGLYQSRTLWQSLEIPVCWENLRAVSAADRDLVRGAANSTWAQHVPFNFSGWGQCAAQSNGIRIGKAEVGETSHTKGLGNQLNGRPDGMMLEFGFDRDPQCMGSEDKRKYCVFVITVHEFGHALGIDHEQNRDDTPGLCNERDRQGPYGDVKVGSWDERSVMNYCNSNWMGDGRLSAGDIQTITHAYAHLTGAGRGGHTAPQGNTSPSGVTLNTCKDVLQCVSRCGTELCQQNCYTSSAPQAQQTFGNLITCNADQNCQGNAECIAQRCYQQAYACDPELLRGQASPGSNPGNNPGAQPSTGSQTCGMVLECMGRCDPNQSSCPENCFYAGTAQAQQSYNTLATCNNNQACQGDANCIAQRCYQEAYSCDPRLVTPQSNPGQNTQNSSTQGQLSGTSDCRGVLQCMNGCSPSDQACLEGCFYRGTAQAQNAFNALNTCNYNQGCQGDGNCIAQRCYQEAYSCDPALVAAQQSSGPNTQSGGTGDCSYLATCLNGCYDATCQDQCVANSSQTALTQYNNLANCSNNSRCTTTECVESSCSAEINACFY